MVTYIEILEEPSPTGTGGAEVPEFEMNLLLAWLTSQRFLGPSPLVVSDIFGRKAEQAMSYESPRSAGLHRVHGLGLQPAAAG